MNAQEFAYWLNGFVELTGTDVPPTPAQWKTIRDHLNLVFKKVTPVTTETTGLGVADFEEIARRFRESQIKTSPLPQSPTPYEYPKYPDPFKLPQTYPDYLFPGYDPTRTVITC